ncbi:phosphopantetheine-binding protein [Methylogaea oryzae]|uniref:phosphopantetheine-binding protein n=1 Tax=Methylogaea oryzae TaxID=1295382 RepID=UPI0006D0AEAA|nr:phosphopantetheine-binding protein [Methylogaea oryzae]
MQLLARIHGEFGVELSLLSLFEAPTVERLALLVETALIEKLAGLSEDEAQCLLEETVAEEAL